MLLWHTLFIFAIEAQSCSDNQYHAGHVPGLENTQISWALFLMNLLSRISYIDQTNWLVEKIVGQLIYAENDNNCFYNR